MSSEKHSLEIQLSHVKQRHSWDCGISCVLMVLPTEKRTHFLANFYKICTQCGFNKSTWTIDLCYLLKMYGVDHIYNTITLGVNPDFKGTHFYEKINKDEKRVVKLFESAHDDGLTVRKQSLDMDDLIVHLQHGPIIVLVDANYLNCDVCSQFKLSKIIGKCLSDPKPYKGHYIVVCGYIMIEEKVLYRDPNYRDRICKMSFSQLTKARKSHGTDEDIILVFPVEHQINFIN